jgi:cation:H+ antiporter
MDIYSVYLLAAGIFLLVLAGDYLVRGAVGLAELLGISPLIVGLTIVACGTSAPELLVSIDAAIRGSPGIAIGNVVGSNIANVLLVIGIPALIAPVAANEPGLRRNMIAMLLVSLVFMWALHDHLLSRTEGAVLLALLACVTWWQIRTGQAMKSKKAAKEATETLHEEIGEPPHDPLRIALSLFAGIVGLPFGAHLTVEGAVSIAQAFGVSDAVIGLSVVAIGTSLPELATTMMAALRGSSAVAIGNVVGSNLFNIAGIMGVTAAIVPIRVEHRITEIDMWVMLATSLILAILAFARLSAGKAIGVAMLFAFAAYLYSIF